VYCANDCLRQISGHADEGSLSFQERVRALPPPPAAEIQVSGFFGCGEEKPTAYKAAGAPITGVPASYVSPEIDGVKALRLRPR
jgi:hypothetical protein